MKDVPKIERPREKLIKYGPGKLVETELLAILLGTGARGSGVLEVSKKIFKKFPKDALVKASVEDLKGMFGLGEAKACEIVACFELGKRLLKDKKARLYLSPKDIWESLKDIRDSKKEHFVVFYLDTNHQEIMRDIISVGTLNASLVHPREVFEPAVRHLAAQIIIAHNHPSSNLQPSDEDIEVTKRLADAGKILGIEVLDHVIVTQQHFFSLKENGMFG
jgi:DNA repair protein RadC